MEGTVSRPLKDLGFCNNHWPREESQEREGSAKIRHATALDGAA